MKKVRCTLEELRKILDESPKLDLYLDSPILQDYIKLNREALFTRPELMKAEVGVILTEDEIVITRKSLLKPR